MNELFTLLKRGNKSALTAAIVNFFVSILKGAAFLFTGNVAMFAETLHSLGDAANQLFVFVGSALSKKAPTDRFPSGFGRVVNLVLLGAVLVVGIMAFEAGKEGWNHIWHPTESTGFLINLLVLGGATLMESFVLFKAMKEILHDTDTHVPWYKMVPASFANYKKANPATKLVFLEDSVATSGGLLAMIAVIIAHFTPFHQAEGIASMIIAILMVYVVAVVFLDNAAGLIGEADEELEAQIGDSIYKVKGVKDVKEVVVIKEGEVVHVELKIEVDPLISMAEADDIQDIVRKKIMALKQVTDVTIELDEDDGVPNWKKEQAKREELEEVLK